MVHLVFNQLSQEPCGPGETAGTDGCRFAAYPWPYSQAAGIVWHEVMHTHGYTHGADDQANALMNCGYAGDRSWHFQVNTMPYLIGDCISSVISLSGDRCGDIDDCAGDNQLRLINGFDSSTCECISDPRQKGLGIVVEDDSELVDEAILPAEAWAGGWHYGSSNKVEKSGDFDGNGRDDILITSPWGIGILTLQGSTFTAMVSKPSGTWFGGWNFNGASNFIAGTGDFNGDGNADILIRSGNWIGILERSGSSLSSLVVKPDGTRFTSWTFDASHDAIRGIGDMNGDGRDDIVVTSSWGIGVLAQIGDTLATIVRRPNGSRFGGWLFDSAANLIVGIADVNGDGSDDLLVRSSWGYGALTRDRASMRDIDMTPHGTLFGSWIVRETDWTVALGNFNGRGGTDILFQAHE